MTVEKSELVRSVTEEDQSPAWTRAQAGTLWKDLKRSVPLTIVDVLSLTGVYLLCRFLGSRLPALDAGAFLGSASHSGLLMAFIMWKVMVYLRALKPGEMRWNRTQRSHQ